jgi:hypothetical protein
VFELMLVSGLIAWWFTSSIPQSIADRREQMRAAKAGQWDHLAKLRETRGQRPVDPPRPGLKAWAKDVWHGAWEDALDRRTKRRANRDPYDPTEPTLTQKAVKRLRAKVAERRSRRGNTAPLPPDDTLAPAPPVERHDCPRCGQTMTRSAAGWTHPAGAPCKPPPRRSPDGRQPWEGPTVQPAATPSRGGNRVIDALRAQQNTERVADLRARAAQADEDAHVAAGYGDTPLAEARREQARRLRAEADAVGHPRPEVAANPAPPRGVTRASRADPDDDGGPVFAQVVPVPHPTTGGTMTAPVQTAPGAATAVADVHTNEALRQAAGSMQEGAAKLAEAAAQAEAARAQMAAAAQAASESVASTSFDGGATAASHAAADAAGAVSDSTISAWCEKAEAVGAAASNVIQSLEKYRDAEDLVASNRISGKTLEPSAS